MSCKYVENKIVDYLEGKVSEEERIKVEDHLLKCRRCRTMVKEVSSVWDYMITPTMSELSPYFWTKLHRRILKYEKPKVWYVPLLGKPIKYFRPAIIAALFIFGVFFGYKLGDSYVNKEVSLYQEKFDENIYFKVFDELPEGSIGDAYVNFYQEF